MYRAPTYAAHPVPGLVHRVQIENDIAQWNGLLYEGASAFEKSHPGSVVRVLDTIPIFDRILDNPKVCSLVVSSILLRMCYLLHEIHPPPLSYI